MYLPSSLLNKQSRIFLHNKIKEKQQKNNWKCENAGLKQVHTDILYTVTVMQPTSYYKAKSVESSKS